MSYNLTRSPSRMILHEIGMSVLTIMLPLMVSSRMMKPGDMVIKRNLLMDDNLEAVQRPDRDIDNFIDSDGTPTPSLPPGRTRINYSVN